MRLVWKIVPLACFAASVVVACGASVSQVYESDVRFERCLALDWGSDIRPDIRRHCWEEWVRYYSDGQTRDRIEYAKRQVAVANGVATSTADDRAQALPEPTSVFAPVPNMAGSATASPALSASASASGPAAASTPCNAKCDKSLEGCLSGCKTPVCEQYCSQKHGRCSDRCAATQPK